MGLFDDDEQSGISHNSIHESMHAGHPKNAHESIHDHNKIHESLHFGKDKVVSPFSAFDDDDDDDDD